MSPSELAIREYRDIVPTPWVAKPPRGSTPEALEEWRRSISQIPVPRRKLMVWLRDSVRASIDEFWRRPTFRDLAAWSSRNLVPGAGTPERQQVEKVDQTLQASAAALLQLTEARSIATELSKTPLKKGAS